MRDEKGVTLIELLVAIVIAGIILVPLLTIMTGTFSRTVSQDQDTRNAYIAQTVIEKVRINDSDGGLHMEGVYCWNSEGRSAACSDADYSLPNLYRENVDSSRDYTIEVTVHPYSPNLSFNEVSVKVSNYSLISTGPESGMFKKLNQVELITVVKKDAS
ncbi:type IV pilus modification PilV family protein [Halalkalibacter alkaliphilus]|uniref:Prepilin-type N-terminal cleavage/methylation domain-containing protein n=1 Tax=Halalkalibacter alkaliphilus TaxID=2917993 RepID=A0A9X2CTQ5_9BACI|nr:prepilin-type N-terminal cleavage/methylation domain-containing protein [Halalkalibacter alkaliphilus]